MSVTIELQNLRAKMMSTERRMINKNSKLWVIHKVFPQLSPPRANMDAMQKSRLARAALHRRYSAWRRLSKLRKAIIVGMAVAVAMISSSILNRGKSDAAINNVSAMACTMLLLLLWGFYRLLLRLPRIVVAVALSVGLHVVGFFVVLDYRHLGWARPLIVPIGFFGGFFEHTFADPDSGVIFGLCFGLSLSITFYALVGWRILVALESRKLAKRQTPQEQSVGLE